jgi:DNA-binding NtrC family response regulator
VARVLLCDDEEALCRGLARMLRPAHEVVTTDGPGGLARLQHESFDAVVTDLRMPGVTGFDILEALRKQRPTTPVIVMSGSAEVHDAVRAMRAGARDFLIKPIETRALEEALANVLGGAAATPEPVPMTDPRVWRDRVAPWLLGNDPAVLPVLATLSQVADTGCTVLITGESGTGKELVAKSIASGSGRAAKPFVAVNCAAIPSGLVESELFGHARGAFTGATTTHPGRFGQADGGTIFLDEIGDMELAVQAKLLRIIQDGELQAVGDTTSQQIDVRVIAATNRKLEAEVAAGRFRADLFWRLNVIPIEMPPLRQRVSDVPLLADHFVKRANDRNRRSVSGFEVEAMRALKRHAWPGNIRELENLVERLVIMRATGPITAADLPPAIRSARDATPTGPTPALPEFPEEGTDLRRMLEQVEERMIAEALERTGGNKNRAAELLGLNRTTLVEKLRRKRVATPSA